MTQTASTALPAYAELHCLSHFSFQRGASSPEELVARAHALGYTALAITDECSMAGVVRAHVAARDTPLHLLLGTELRVETPHPRHATVCWVLLAKSRRGYGQLCTLISALRTRRQPDGRRYRVRWSDWLAHAATLDDVIALMAPARAHDGDNDTETLVAWVQAARAVLGDRLWLALELHHAADDSAWLATMQQVGTHSGVRLVAAGQVLMHVRARKPLQDVLTAVGQGRAVHDCGFALQPNAEAHLRSRVRLASQYPPELLAATLEIAAACQFKLDELRYEYPQEVVPAGETPASYLRRSTWEGAGRRYPQGVSASVSTLIERELALIAELHYEKYFLTVYDIVRFARSRGILCQGRGSAANSAVCYCLGITEVDPARMQVLFERFISRERGEPPDIDVDFEHERREEVIQYLYTRFGRDRAALTAAVITYGPRSAIRDVGKALGLPAETVERLARHHQWWDGRAVRPEAVIELGLDPSDRRLQLLCVLTAELARFPRHLSQHTGGFVLTGEPLTQTVPVVPAAMADRTTLEWDKDDIDALGLLKVDVLALGMLSAIRRTLDLHSAWRGETMLMQDIPPEDPATYEMICRADTVGVFQIESRAQMSMLPRLRPRVFYDLVIEVAIVRPGPIQGGMVHPYLKQRARLQRGQAIDYPSDALRPALERTLGVPIFQEQVMQVAIIAAGFTPGEADALRRSMAAWRRKGGIDQFGPRLIAGMQARGYSTEFAQAICRQIEGFGEYGFPESHAASFALLVYVSAWLKRHAPAAFLAGLLNAQPMGFYAPSQLVQDARRHGVEVLPVDVLYSTWESALAPSSAGPAPAVRLGLRLVKGLAPVVASRIAQACAVAPFVSVTDLAQRAALGRADLRLLAAADALASLAGHRRLQVWEAGGIESLDGVLADTEVDDDWPDLPPAPEGEEVMFDYAAQGLSLRAHPLALLREALAPWRVEAAQALGRRTGGQVVRACGLVTTRQRPATAKGVIFLTLEDETGMVQVIVPREVQEAQRAALLESRLLAVRGVWQRQGRVCHVLAHRLLDLSALLGQLHVASRDFH